MNKIYAAMIIGAVAWCAASAEACSPRLDGGETYCPPFDEPLKPKPTLPKEEMRGELDVYNIHHWTAIQGMFIRNQRREEIEKNMTHPSDAINTAIESFMEIDHGSDGTTEQEELLQLPSDGNK
tara:strand:- start:229 stop:600 length:372 start_codon:yes stop_codon:yes gene_type:complete